jgi:hypothetical protein
MNEESQSKKREENQRDKAGPVGGSKAVSGETVDDACRLARVRGLATFGLVASVALACSPLQINWCRESRPRRWESWRDLVQIVGIVSKSSVSYAIGLDRVYSANMGGIVSDSSFPCCYGAQRRDLTTVVPGLSG